MNVTKKETGRTRQKIYVLSGLEKINTIAFLEVKLLAENPCKGWKIEYFPKVEDLLIQKRGNISIRCFAYSQRRHCWLVAESFYFVNQIRGNPWPESSSWIAQNCYLHNKA